MKRYFKRYGKHFVICIINGNVAYTFQFSFYIYINVFFLILQEDEIWHENYKWLACIERISKSVFNYSDMSDCSETWTIQLLSWLYVPSYTIRKTVTINWNVPHYNM